MRHSWQKPGLWEYLDSFFSLVFRGALTLLGILLVVTVVGMVLFGVIYLISMAWHAAI